MNIVPKYSLNDNFGAYAGTINHLYVLKHTKLHYSTSKRWNNGMKIFFLLNLL